MSTAAVSTAVSTVVPSSTERYLTVREAAVERRVGIGRVYHLLWGNKLPGAVRVDGKWLIPASSVAR